MNEQVYVTNRSLFHTFVAYFYTSF